MPAVGVGTTRSCKQAQTMVMLEIGMAVLNLAGCCINISVYVLKQSWIILDIIPGPCRSILRCLGKRHAKGFCRRPGNSWQVAELSWAMATAIAINKKRRKLTWSYCGTLKGKQHGFWKSLAGSYQQKNAAHCKVRNEAWASKTAGWCPTDQWSPKQWHHNPIAHRSCHSSGCQHWCPGWADPYTRLQSSAKNTQPADNNNWLKLHSWLLYKHCI